MTRFDGRGGLLTLDARAGAPPARVSETKVSEIDLQRSWGTQGEPCSGRCAPMRSVPTLISPELARTGAGDTSSPSDSRSGPSQLTHRPRRAASRVDCAGLRDRKAKFLGTPSHDQQRSPRLQLAEPRDDSRACARSRAGQAGRLRQGVAGARASARTYSTRAGQAACPGVVTRPLDRHGHPNVVGMDLGHH